MEGNAAESSSREQRKAEKRAAKERQRKGSLADSTPSRESKARQFTVGNIGNNGMMYLRPVIQKGAFRKSAQPNQYAGEVNQNGQKQEQGAGTQGLKPSTGRDSFYTNLSSVPTHQGASRFERLQTISNQAAGAQLGPAGDGPRLDGDTDPGALKIVIDREHAPEAFNAYIPFPGIEVPIPNYRLGSPQFSEKGGAFIQQSVYTRSSVNGDDGDKDTLQTTGSGYQQLFHPQTIDENSVPSRHLSASSHQQLSIAMSSTPNYVIGPSAYNRPLRIGPISPQVFDPLDTNPDNPEIVRYSPINGEIIAASPARIIAQITNQNFLDYELLSDFFLTVRAYLSTHDLLSYILARFEWSINKFDDVGRVIRVRTFAALRHWILNYFTYDFVPDRSLRVKFCERLNYLSSVVKARADYGVSDMKLIMDLKKCWSGRCALYWEQTPMSADGQQDMDIQPGGGLGEEQFRFESPSQPASQPSQPPPGTAAPAQLDPAAASVSNWYNAVMEHSERQFKGHARQASTATSRSLPVSPISEQSQQVISCSVPRKLIPGMNRPQGPHPVTSTEESPSRAAAPHLRTPEPTRRESHHQRSESLPDVNVGMRAPNHGARAGNYNPDPSLQNRSLLRGSLVPPLSPYINVAQLYAKSDAANNVQSPTTKEAEQQQQGRKGSKSDNPAVKSFIGNIKRALSSKATANSPAPIHTGSSNTPQSGGKFAATPINTVPEDTPFSPTDVVRDHGRIDLLAANVFETYQALGRFEPQVANFAPAGRAMAQAPPSLLNSYMENRGFETPWQTESGGLRTEVNELSTPAFGTENSSYDPSNIATQRSIQTDSANINPSEPSLRSNEANQSDSTRTHGFTPSPLHIPGKDGIASGKELSIPALQKLQQRSHQSTQSSSSLRRYASFQSTLNKAKASDYTVDPDLLADLSADDSKPGQPARMLRRRPGGDLKANQNVTDLDRPQRPKSTGSTTSFADSMRGIESLALEDSVLRRSVYNNVSQTGSQAGGDGKTREEKTPSMVQRRSSHPERRRPSFEATISQFAQIPDEDDGGVEIALLKLEGKYKSPIQSPVAQDKNAENQFEKALAANKQESPTPKTNGQKEKEKEPKSATSPTSKNGQEDGRENIASTLYTESEASYNSVPLLERGTNVGPGQQIQPEQIPNDQLMSYPPPEDDDSVDLHSRRNLRRSRYESGAPTATTDSFLLDEDDSFSSDLSSSGISVNERYSQIEQEDHDPNLDTPGSSFRNRPTSHLRVDNDSFNERRHPTTPIRDFSASSKGLVDPAKGDQKHLPFILSCDSEVIAQQLTIVEKDALKEIDWRDLVDMRWQNSPTSTTNWADFLRTQVPVGIDLVTARFNIVVKWALSEIVLTENLDERALTISKFIQIAHHAKKCRNYATLLQLTIALTSNDCARLSKTWEKVPAVEKQVLADLETLVSPRRNFYNLRLEMEKANGDQGCIPVVALFLHDLTYNSQKPASLPGDLVNFERFRSTAVIVKSLLRLIDTSTRYELVPADGIIHRCIWLASLPDEIISYRSKQVEYIAA